MWRSFLAVVGIAAIANFASWWLIGRSVEPEPWDRPLNGVSFSPYRAGQDPRAGEHPSIDDIDADLEILSGRVHQIRTYSATDGLDAIAPLARRHGLQVMAGAWIDGRLKRNRDEIDNLITLARNYGNVTRLLVGNETLLRADIAADALIGYIREVRLRANRPVSTAEPWHVWLAHPELGREVDFIAVHILPYWEGLPADQAISYVLRRYQEVKDAFPTKPVVLTEVGWPSQGRMRRAANPGPLTQARFIRDFVNEADRRGLDYFVMEAFDQPWKSQIEGSVGAYWGIFDADRLDKFAFAGPVSGLPLWPALALAATILALPFSYGFLRYWPSISFAGKAAFATLLQAAASVLVYVGHSGFAQYASLGTIAQWAILIPLLGLLLLMALTEGLEFADVVFGRTRRREFLPFLTDIERQWPKVSIHVPTYNEPADMVCKTLDALARLDYPNYEVLVVDNNTKDEAVWRPVEAHCQALGSRFRFFHVAPLSGFKAGALNFARRQMAEDADIIGVIDADYLVEPDWLKSVVPYFDRAEVGFIQAPQDHYDWTSDRFKEMLNFEYAGFFHIGMVQRNEANAIIQHGTMTLLRRTALDRVGGWAEWCVCEDAEMGLRLFGSGWQSVYINRRFGYGRTPDTFSGYKSQRFRWAYGAIQILKRHWREFIPGRGRLSPLQSYHFLTGWMAWFADALGLAFAGLSLVWTAGVLFLPRHFDFPLTVFVVPALAVFAAKILQFFWLYRVRVKCSLRQQLGAAIAGLALTFTVAKATAYGLIADKLPFVRTPKHEGEPALGRALAMAREEAILFTLLWLAAAAVWRAYGGDDPEASLWALLMAVQSLPYGAALGLAAFNTLPARRRQRALEPMAAPVQTSSSLASSGLAAPRMAPVLPAPILFDRRNGEISEPLQLATAMGHGIKNESAGETEKRQEHYSG
jgi:exo-beta-1,3-glucanase (GH17 family)/cellulose synthase/poly-beta-1,6-N-acetylglucosamine synthase-like glycosyltransferase